MRSPDELLAGLAEHMRTAHGLEAMLQLVADTARELVDGERASVRMLDESRTQLLVAARSGLVSGVRDEFRVGEGLAGWIVANGEAVLVEDAERDPRFVTKVGQIAPLGAFAGVPLVDVAGPIGVLSVSGRDALFTQTDVRWLTVIAGLATPYLDVARLHRISITDDLTLALNRRALDALIPPHDNAELSVVLVDIDHFKAINDRHGHGVGDEVLRTVPRLLKTMLRRDDEVVRLGGDEFLMVLRGVDADAAQVIAERACQWVAGASIVGQPITLSAGVAERLHDESRDHLLERADRALYRAKELGRNQAALAR
ncbi:MAG: sensor domain-containing diguanylate cyclase [Kofleriaceae bacterium]